MRHLSEHIPPLDQHSAPIILVDGDAQNARCVKDALAGFTVVECERDALFSASILDLRPGLILLDLQGALAERLATCRRCSVHEALCDVPVILMAERLDSRERAEGLRAGAADIISKPFPPEEGLAKITTHFAFRALRTAHAELEVHVRERTDELLKANRMLHMLSEFNQAVVRSEDETDLLKKICRVVVELGGYPLAWAGFVESSEAKVISPVAQAGFAEGMPRAVPLIRCEAPEDHIAQALLLGEPCCTTDIRPGPHASPWTETILRRKCSSGIALPVRGENRVIGVVVIYAAEPDAFHKTEVDLLMEMTGDLSYGVIALRAQADRRRAEEELFNSRQMLRTVLDTIPQRVFWKDRNLVYVGCNKPLALDCGYGDPNDMVGKSDYETASAETAEAYRADDRQVMDSGLPKLNYEESQIKPDGSKAWLMTSKVPLRDKDGRVIGVLGTYEDISTYRLLEEQLRQAQKMEAFGQLSGGIAHDFNNLLTVIRMNVSMLQTFPHSDGEKAAALKDMSHAVDQGANLIRQLLAFSRRQPMRLSTLDLNEIVGNTTTMLKRLIGEHISLEAALSPAIEPASVDAGMMEQVLINLAINSRDAMPQGGRLIVRTAPVKVGGKQAAARPGARPGDYVRLSVSDTGGGIAPEHLPHIFEPFFTTKDVGKGTGLGLATVFGIVAQHHGWIEVESTVNRGTTFHIYVPQAARQTAPALPAGAAQEAAGGGSETILFVEDDTAIRQLLTTLLTRCGYTVCDAGSGAEALERWRRHGTDVDLLITDMIMPHGISGRELAQRLRGEKPGLKVVFCSGYTADHFSGDSPLRPEEHFLQKPFEPQTFLHLVRRVLDGLPCG